MKKISLYLTALLLTVATPLHAEEEQVCTTQADQKGSLTITITNFRAIKGSLGISLYNTKKGFPSGYEQAYANQIKKVNGSSECVTFQNIPYGVYAVSVVHDENENGKLDTTFIGIPKEGVGASNNPKMSFGPPSFNDSKVLLNKDVLEVMVSMKYF
uniref:DUF2141 domain-containing protein n=1 Tax=Chlorobium chlorochromatii (strain CaD3) TaxID=340177 RepID=Q3ARS1_CHLCH